ncbi:MAG TPA: hypothetical protein PLJ13_10735, partial [Cyclobacteriaceae bacterium]|nr:hypothetical protein [Cyclobacteriaceae bacterium]
MKRLLIAFVLGSAQVVVGQPEQKFIKEENVTRVIKTLTADEMMGRSASRPEHIDKAAAFIAGEFKSIGLKPLDGLTGFRQEFKKDMIAPQSLEVTINGQKIPAENALLVTEATELNLTRGAGVIVIPYDTAIKNTRQFLLSKAFNLIRDTATAFVLVAPEFKENFKELKGYFGKRFTSGRRTNKIF